MRQICHFRCQPNARGSDPFHAQIVSRACRHEIPRVQIGAGLRATIEPSRPAQQHCCPLAGSVLQGRLVCATPCSTLSACLFLALTRTGAGARMLPSRVSTIKGSVRRERFDEDFAFLPNNQACFSSNARHGGVVLRLRRPSANRTVPVRRCGTCREPESSADAFTGNRACPPRNNAGKTTAYFAHAAANGFARLQQRTAGRPFGDTETLIEHAQLAPCARMFFMGCMPLGKFFALQRTAGIKGQLPGNRRVQHMRRYGSGTGRTHVGSPYSAM